MNSSANDTQVGGAHYRTDIQHWDMVAVRGLDYFQGQATKYVTRWRSKNGLQDLHKARHFLVKMIELYKAGMLPVTARAYGTRSMDISMDVYAEANRLLPVEKEIITAIVEWERHEYVLIKALDQLDELIARQEGSGPGSGYAKQG